MLIFLASVAFLLMLLAIGERAGPTCGTAAAVVPPP
jgi:hypothetical protein